MIGLKARLAGKILDLELSRGLGQDGQHLIEQRGRVAITQVSFGQLGPWSLGDDHPAQDGIVRQYELAIRGSPDIELDRVGNGTHGEEAGNRVLRIAGGPPPVAYDLHLLSHALPGKETCLQAGSLTVPFWAEIPWKSRPVWRASL